MERRAASHTEEEELNQRRRLLNSARKGDPKAINRLFELYQVRVYSGELLMHRKGRLPQWPSAHEQPGKGHQKPGKMATRKRVSRRPARAARRIAARKPSRLAVLKSRRSARRKAARRGRR
jgi:hypothetical protein